MTTLTPFPPISAPLVEGRDDESVKLAKQMRLSQVHVGWFRNLYNLLKPGVTADVVIGATTLHFVNGQFTGSSP